MITQVITRIASFKQTFYCHTMSCIGPACCLRWEQFLQLILNRNIEQPYPFKAYSGTLSRRNFRRFKATLGKFGQNVVRLVF